MDIKGLGWNASVIRHTWEIQWRRLHGWSGCLICAGRVNQTGLGVMLVIGRKHWRLGVMSLCVGKIG